ncbi:MAG: glycosyltransferase [Planctomycetes bacterium]|nr:glycosyltransferase [Planctomycetota bacterium]
MKVLHALHSFPPDSRGGIETYVLGLSRAQQRAGDEPIVLAGSDRGEAEPSLRETRVEGVRVLRLRPPPAESRALDGLDPEARALLEEVLRRERPDLLHLHHWHNLTSDAIETAAGLGIPAVVSVHDLFSTCPLFFRLPDDANLCPADLPRETCVRCIGRFLSPLSAVEEGFLRRDARFRRELDLARAVLAISETEREFLAAVPWLAGVPFRTLPLPPPPLDVGRVEPTPRDPAFDLRLVSWGGLVQGKGLHVLVEACEGLDRAERVSIDHHGRILDEGYRERLLAAARRARLRLHGSYEPADSARLFSGYDVAVFPSFFLETHSFAVDEALELGLPVLVSDRGAPRQRVGARGVVFPAGDAGALRRILGGFLADPSRLSRLRSGAPVPPVRMEDHLAALREIYSRAGRPRAFPASP